MNLLGDEEQSPHPSPNEILISMEESEETQPITETKSETKSPEEETQKEKEQTSEVPPNAQPEETSHDELEPAFVPKTDYVSHILTKKNRKQVCCQLG